MYVRATAVMTMPEAQAWSVIFLTGSTAIVSIVSALRTARNGQQIKTLSGKTDEIHTLVNSSMTELRTKNEMLMTLMSAKDVQKAVDDMTRDTLAGAAAQALRTMHEQETPLPVVITDPQGHPESLPLQVTVTPPKKP